MTKMLRLGYHRVSDDSVTSAWLTIEEANLRLKELAYDPDVDQMWTRNDNNEITWKWDREGS